MSGGRTTFQQWYASAPVPWLVAGPNGQKEAGTWPAVLDQLSQQMDDARKCAYPDYSPVDALPHLGGDRQLIQGSNESDVSFRTRLKDAWGQWGRAGTACGVLEQLYYFGLSGAVWVQQNGLQYTLSGAPTPGQDPTSLVVASNCPATGGPIASSTAPYRSIPAGTPWAFLDANTDLCNRFAIKIPSFPFSAITQATFTNSDSAAITFPFQFGNISYALVYGMPTAPVVLSEDVTARTTTGTTIRASGPWSGTVYVIAWNAGVNPLNTFSFASLGTLQRIISTFRPNAICTSVYAINSGRVLGDGRHLGDGGVLGGSVTQILGSF